MAAMMPRSPTATTQGAANPLSAPSAVWIVVGVGFCLLLASSSYYLWNHVWDQEAYAHGPIIVAILAWLVWRQPLPAVESPSFAVQLQGWLLLVGGSILFVIGRSQNVPVVDVTGLIPIALGLLLIAGGWRAVRNYWFALLFMFFLIPLPGFLLEMVTGPLKQAVSVLAEQLLFAAGYPIARSGVVLSIGQYQLLVADACSGLNSLLSLSAMGLIYLHLMSYRSRWRNLILVLSIVPIAFAANLVRVIALVLITYHIGDEAGQGFLHGFAGTFLFILALLMMFALDRLLGWARIDAGTNGKAIA